MSKLTTRCSNRSIAFISIVSDGIPFVDPRPEVTADPAVISAETHSLTHDPLLCLSASSWWKEESRATVPPVTRHWLSCWWTEVKGHPVRSKSSVSTLWDAGTSTLHPIIAARWPSPYRVSRTLDRSKSTRSFIQTKFVFQSRQADWRWLRPPPRRPSQSHWGVSRLRPCLLLSVTSSLRRRDPPESRPVWRPWQEVSCCWCRGSQVFLHSEGGTPGLSVCSQWRLARRHTKYVCKTHLSIILII